MQVLTPFVGFEKWVDFGLGIVDDIEVVGLGWRIWAQIESFVGPSKVKMVSPTGIVSG